MFNPHESGDEKMQITCDYCDATIPIDLPASRIPGYEDRVCHRCIEKFNSDAIREFANEIQCEFFLIINGDKPNG